MIWIIGGTKDSREITEELLSKTENKIIVSTATSYGGTLLKKYEEEKNRFQTVSEKLDEEQMKNLIREKKIRIIVDASHPYAVNVSTSAIKVAKEMNIGYVRFERKMLDYGNEGVKRFNTLKEINEYVCGLENKKILSTLGSNNLSEIKEMEGKNKLYVRILPTSTSIIKAEELGYLPSRIIAVQGPFSESFNKAMLLNYDIDFLITKESGATGGEEEKIKACRECGVTVLVLKRPYVNYGKVFNEKDSLINGIKKLSSE